MTGSVNFVLLDRTRSRLCARSTIRSRSQDALTQIEAHVSPAHKREVLAENTSIPVVFCGQTRRHENDVSFLRELADAREDCVSNPAAEHMVVVASVGEESLHGVDQEVVVHQPGRYVGGQEFLESFEDGVFSGAGEAVEDDDEARVLHSGGVSG